MSNFFFQSPTWCAGSVQNGVRYSANTCSHITANIPLFPQFPLNRICSMSVQIQVGVYHIEWQGMGVSNHKSAKFSFSRWLQFDIWVFAIRIQHSRLWIVYDLVLEPTHTHNIIQIQLETVMGGAISTYTHTHRILSHNHIEFVEYVMCVCACVCVQCTRSG